ncbi:MAG: nucleotidyltransferase [Planctomycetaceae bacterium]|nr:nucleotidyltransferase [Planctomycetaceae bacterium]
MSELIRSLEEVTAAFDRLTIPYAVMGGLAVRAHGLPRPTYDVDFTIAIERPELPGLMDELEDMGYTVPEIYRSGWVDRVAEMPLFKFCLMIGGNSIAVDVFLAETDFLRSALQRRLRAEIDGVTVNVVSPEDLILLKMIARRPRDIGDIIDVRFAQGDLDETYLREWAGRLKIAERFDEIWRETAP